MLLFAFLVASSAAAASGTARIVLVASDGSELARKVRAEAEHVGISIASERATQAPKDAELLARHAAIGVVEIASPDRVRIHVAPSGEHGAYDATIERAPADGDGFALRVVEQVRGRLVELRLLPPDPEASGPVVAADPSSGPVGDARPSGTTKDQDGSQPAEGRHAPKLGLAVGGAATAAVGGLGVTPGVALGLRLEPADRWAVSLNAVLPVVENEIEAPEGEASVRVNLFFAELGYRLTPPAAPLGPELGAGAGLVVLPMEGEAAPPREGHSDQLVAGVYFLHGGVGWTLTSWLRLRGVARLGLSAPRAVLRFSEREVAAWGRGFVAGTLAAEFRLPLSGSEEAP